MLRTGPTCTVLTITVSTYIHFSDHETVPLHDDNTRAISSLLPIRSILWSSYPPNRAHSPPWRLPCAAYNSAFDEKSLSTRPDITVLGRTVA